MDTGDVVWEYDTGGEMWGTLGPLLVEEQDMVCVGTGGAATYV